MSSGDETFLESFIGESLATLPHEMRRSMELIKDLDQRCQADLRQLLELQHQFLYHQAEETILSQLQVVEMMPDDDNDDDNVGDTVAVTTDDNQEDNRDEEVKLDGKLDGSDEHHIHKKRKRGTKKTKNYGVLVLKPGIATAASESSIPPDHDPQDYNPDTDAVIPTTDELLQLIANNNNDNNNKSNNHGEIRRLQRTCWQLSDEKVAVARQAWERLDAHVQRLDADLLALEQQFAQQHGPDWAVTMLLMMGGGNSTNNNNNSNNSSNNNHATLHTKSSGKPNDLVACQVTPDSEWILAKIIRHDPGTGNYKLADEDSESHKSA